MPAINIYNFKSSKVSHEERPGVCRKKGDGNGVTWKEEKREAEE